MSPTPPSSPYSFSIARMLLATAIIAVALTITKPLGPRGALVGMIIGLSLAGVALFSHKQHVRPIIRTLIWCGIGMFFGGLLSPAAGSRPGMSPGIGGQIVFIGGGAFVGWIVGIVVSLGKSSEPS